MKNSQIRGFTVSNLLAGAYRLDYLDLSNNLLREIPRNFFQNNHIMKTLIMSNNQIRSLRPEIFQPMKQIEVLDLSNNQLQTFNKKLMKFASKLKVLKLNGNNIGPSLQKWAFHKLPQLTELDLRYVLLWCTVTWGDGGGVSGRLFRHSILEGSSVNLK